MTEMSRSEKHSVTSVNGTIYTTATGNVNFFQRPPGGDREPAVPHHLLRDVHDFTGRVAELEQITRQVNCGSMVIIAVAGAPGIGKTALVMHAAHKMTSSADSPPPFPGGHLYADLRGFGTGEQPPAEPGEVLGDFLRHMGVSEDEIPQRTEERSTRFRNMLAAKRTLLVLDNAASAEQVLPLLPGEGASLVLVTSRSVLSGLAVNVRIHLGDLPDEDGKKLMTKLIGAQRASAEPGPLADVVDTCGGSPLALWIAGQWLATGRERSIDQLAEWLADEQTRLDRLAAGNVQVRAAYAVSYRQLPDRAQRVFRLLGLFPGPRFDKYVAASLAGITDPEAAADALDRLTEAHLIIEERAGRFRMHDLLRLFAKETCEAYDDDADRVSARERMVGHFMNIAWYLNECLEPRLRFRFEKDPQYREIVSTQRDALAHFAEERTNLLAVIRLAADQGWHETVWQFSDLLGGALTLSRNLDDLLAVRTAGLAAARSAKETAACSRALANLGNVYADLRRFDEAIKLFEEDLAICEQESDLIGECLAHGNLGSVYSELGRFTEAVDRYRRALDICDVTGEKYCSGQIQGNLGNVYQKKGDFDRAIESYLKALRITWETGDRRGEGEILNNLGITCLKQGRFAKAIECFEDDGAICRRLGDKSGEALSLGNLGSAYYEQGKFVEAIDCYQRTLVICREIGDRHSEGHALGNLALASYRLGQHEQVVSYLREAAQAMRESGDLEAAARYEKTAPAGLPSAAQSRRPWWRRA